MMTKCDFCIYFNPTKGCYWVDQSSREDDCERAIERMEAALAAIGTANLIIPSEDSLYIDKRKTFTLIPYKTPNKPIKFTFMGDIESEEE